MGDGDDGGVAELPPDGLLYAEVGGGVHGGRRLVQHQDLRPPARIQHSLKSLSLCSLVSYNVLRT